MNYTAADHQGAIEKEREKTRASNGTDSLSHGIKASLKLLQIQSEAHNHDITPGFYSIK